MSQPWPPDVHTRTLPPVQAPTPRVPPPPPRLSRAPAWAAGIATIITTLGTAIGGASYLITQERSRAAAETVAGARSVESRLVSIESTLRTMLEDQQTRDIVQLAVLCELNRGSPARSVRCPPNACEPRLLAPDGSPLAGQPICRAAVDWPPLRRGP